MDEIGRLYSMRGAAAEIGGTDPRTLTALVFELGIPRYRAAKAILIDAAGLARLREHYRAKRPNAMAS